MLKVLATATEIFLTGPTPMRYQSEKAWPEVVLQLQRGGQVPRSITAIAMTSTEPELEGIFSWLLAGSPLLVAGAGSVGAIHCWPTSSSAHRRSA